MGRWYFVGGAREDMVVRMESDPPLPAATAIRLRNVRQELIKLTALVAVAIAAFMGTQTFAAHSRAVNAADAATWFARGQDALAHDQVDAAVDAYRRALAKAKDNRVYSLALARALERTGDVDAAERALLALRQSAPEDGDINLELARISARRADVATALRYYRNALYSPASAADESLRRGVRLELINFLLARGESSRALAELLTAANDAPTDEASAVRLGGLFAQAQDYRRARDEYRRALQIAPHDAYALVGAGSMAFQLGDYAEARRDLAASASVDPAIIAMLDVATHVLADDPLGIRLGSSERYRRLAADLMTVSNRLHACLMHAGPNDAVTTAAHDIDAFSMDLRRQRANPDLFDDGLSVMFKAEQAVPSSCGDPSAADRALVLIAHLHGADIT